MCVNVKLFGKSILKNAGKVFYIEFQSFILYITGSLLTAIINIIWQTLFEI